jgi:S-adenosylmethionine/arginine decarboxylase-like enzyme
VEEQHDMDEKVLELVQTMAEVYSFVDDVQYLDKVKRLQEVVLEIAKQTVECAIFIREYTGRGFTGIKFVHKSHRSVHRQFRATVSEQVVRHERTDRWACGGVAEAQKCLRPWSGIPICVFLCWNQG